ncbi:MAG: NAD(P)/FAD-dependent oxidoreductase [Pseudomonadota bacterium]
MVVKYDVVVLGAGAAGLFCAIEAAKRGRTVVVIDHAKRLGGKILMSGGGRCNFTNMYASPENFLSQNPHFCKSALSRYTQWDFVSLVEQYNIAYHEKTLGQLFCDNTAKDIVDMLLAECAKVKVNISNRTNFNSVRIANNEDAPNEYAVETSKGIFTCQSFVVATGGLSMPKLGATPIGYRIAEQFGIPIVPTRAALVPFTLHDHDKETLSALSGISVDASATCDSTVFDENILFTHRGLSGPAVLQISSYWQPGQSVSFDLAPRIDLNEVISQAQQASPNQLLSNALGEHYPKRMLQTIIPHFTIQNKPLKQYTPAEKEQVVSAFSDWQVTPNGTEGYRTAEVTLGGVDTDYLSSKTMESQQHKGLYFIGEVVDVTGWLGGYNFQWAWSSGWVAGQVV